jgi:MoaA/NifB/PqqE/SkfB family radical SAM enzyme
MNYLALIKNYASTSFACKRKVAGLLGKYGAMRLTGKQYPFFVEMRVTNRCMLKCAYCSIWSRKTYEMSTVELKSVIDKISKDCFWIHLSGGEPLLRTDIDEIIQYIHDQPAMILSLATNGYNFRRHIDYLPLVDRVIISLDGPREVHDSVRGIGSFDKTIEALELCREHGIMVTTNMTLTAKTIDYLDETVRIASRYGATVSYEPILYHGLVGKDAEGLALNPARYRAALDNMDYATSAISKPCMEYIKGYPDAFTRKLRCYGGRAFFLIDCDGGIYPCYSGVDKVKTVNILEGNLRDLLPQIRADPTCCCGSNLFNELNLVAGLNPRTIAKQVFALGDALTKSTHRAQCDAGRR